MRVAVIGGTGFVGARVVEALARAGHAPIAVARHARRVTSGDFRPADLGDMRSLARALAGVDAVVSCAGGLRQSRRQTYHDLHFRGARHLVEACRAERVRRVVHVSSLGAHPGSRSAFHRSKYLGEEVVRRSLLDVTVVRPAPIFGPGDDFVGPLARMIERLPVAPLPGRGTARLQPVAVEDVVEALTHALERGGTIGEAYDLPGPEVLAIGEIYDRVMLALGRRRPKVSVPYVVIEPLVHLLGRPAVGRFTFEHLTIVEEAVAADPGLAVRALGIEPRRMDVAAIRACFS